MSTKKALFEDILTTPFQIKNFERFSLEFFNNPKMLGCRDITNDYWNWTEFSFHIGGYYHVANFTGSDNTKISVFAVLLKNSKNLDRARSMQRNFAKKLMKAADADGAIVSFYAENELKWRLSFVKLDYDFAKGKVTEKITPAKRYSYLVGKGEPCHTALERLYPIFMNEDANPTIEEIEEAFSVEKVTKDFFEQYKEKYHQLRERLEANQDFIAESERLGFTNEQFAKKLMGQLAFLYFIQKKGWLGVNVFPKKPLTKKQYVSAFHSRGKASREVIPKIFNQTGEDEYRRVVSAIESLSKSEAETAAAAVKGEPWGTGPRDFIRKLFQECVKKEGNFFDDYLEPLFYEALNEKRGANDYYYRFKCRIPFLNGGLFEPLENYDWDENNFNIQNELFSNSEGNGILDIFERYNFTMNEDEPLEKEVAVDPEMLGKIFENLLDAKDRKSKGAFYTPREIVHYMCQESLVNYLVSKTGISYGAIKDFIVYGEFMKDEDTTREAKEGIGELYISEEIFDRKNNINRLIEIDDALANIKVADPAVGSGAFPLGMISEIVKARRNITEYLAMIMTNKTAIREMYEAERHPLTLKLHTIKNSIFAVDIEPSAVDITKLRLWLSLVVEQEINEHNDDNGIYAESRNPKPLPNLDCNIRCGNSLIDELDGATLINESELLGNSQHQIMLGQNHYESLLKQLFQAQDKLFYEKNHDEKESLKTTIRAIIDKIVMFSIEGNQTIVERYNELRNNPSPPFFLWKLEFARVFRENGGFDVVIGNPPYVLLQDITKDKVIVESYRKKYIVAKYKIDLYHLFIERAYYLLNKNGINSYIAPSNFTTNNYCDDLRKFILNHMSVKNIIFYDENVFEANVNNLVYVALKTPMSESLIEMCKAKKEGNVWSYYEKSLSAQHDLMIDDYLIVLSGGQSNRDLLSKIEDGSISIKSFAKVNFGMQLRDRKKFPNDVVTNESELTGFHKKCYTGKNIDRFVVSYSNMYCYFNRAEAKCGGCWDENAHFSAPKILVRQIGSFPIAGMDTDGYAVLNTAFMITMNGSDPLLFALLGIINSSLIRYYWKNKFMDNRKQFPKIKGSYLEQLPIKSNDKIHSQIATITQNIILTKQSDPAADISAHEIKIDRMVYELYGLTEEEIAIVEESVK